MTIMITISNKEPEDGIDADKALVVRSYEVGGEVGGPEHMVEANEECELAIWPGHTYQIELVDSTRKRVVEEVEPVSEPEPEVDADKLQESINDTTPAAQDLADTIDADLLAEAESEDDAQWFDEKSEDDLEAEDSGVGALGGDRAYITR